MIGKGKVVQSVSVIVSVPEHVSSVLWMCLCDRLTSKQKNYSAPVDGGM